MLEKNKFAKVSPTKLSCYKVVFVSLIDDSLEKRTLAI